MVLSYLSAGSWEDAVLLRDEGDIGSADSRSTTVDIILPSKRTVPLLESSGQSIVDLTGENNTFKRFAFSTPLDDHDELETATNKSRVISPLVRHGGMLLSPGRRDENLLEVALTTSDDVVSF